MFNNFVPVSGSFLFQLSTYPEMMTTTEPIVLNGILLLSFNMMSNTFGKSFLLDFIGGRRGGKACNLKVSWDAELLRGDASSPHPVFLTRFVKLSLACTLNMIHLFYLVPDISFWAQNLQERSGVCHEVRPECERAVTEESGKVKLNLEVARTRSRTRSV